MFLDVEGIGAGDCREGFLARGVALSGSFGVEAMAAADLIAGLLGRGVASSAFFDVDTMGAEDSSRDVCAEREASPPFVANERLIFAVRLVLATLRRSSSGPARPRGGQGDGSGVREGDPPIGEGVGACSLDA